jgi:hypothetical protein
MIPREPRRGQPRGASEAFVRLRSRTCAARPGSGTGCGAARRTGRSSGSRILLLLLASVLCGLACSGHDPEPGLNTGACARNLGSLYCLLVELREENPRALMGTEGREFLLRVASRVRREDLRVFICPSDPSAPSSQDPANLYCSYRGADRQTIERWVAEQPGAPFVIAGDRCGMDGRAVFHRRGVMVLWSHGRTELLRLSDGGVDAIKPVGIGPGCPDDRLAKLIW